MALIWWTITFLLQNIILIMWRRGSLCPQSLLWNSSQEEVWDRATPYHFPHTTEIAGCAFVHGSDDRFYQNIFVGGAANYSGDSFCGTVSYNGCPVSLEEYISVTSAYQGEEDKETFVKTKQPAYIDCNVYLNGADGFEREEHRMLIETDPKIKVAEEDDQVILEIYADSRIVNLETQVIDTEKLGMVRIAEAPFDNPDGTPIVLDTDYFGRKRKENPTVGPFEGLKAGMNRIKVWR